MMINKGEKFTRFNLTCKRPGNGISPMNWYKIIGKKAKKNLILMKSSKINISVITGSRAEYGLLKNFISNKRIKK